MGVCATHLILLIRHMVTVSYSAEQNGVAGRYIRLVCEASHAMLIESKQPKFLWAEAIANADYVKVRVPAKWLFSIYYQQTDCPLFTTFVKGV